MSVHPTSFRLLQAVRRVRLPRTVARLLLFGLGAALAGFLSYDMGADWLLEDKPFWTTLLENVLPLLLTLLLPATGWYYRNRPDLLSEMAKWGVLGCGGTVGIVGGAIGLQAVQQELKPLLIAVQAGAIGAFAGLLMGQMVAELKDSRNRALQEQDRLETLFGGVPTPVVRCELAPEGTLITEVNPAFEAVFGVAAEAVRGQDIDELIVPDDRRDEAVGLARRAVEEHAQEAEVRRIAAAGERDFKLKATGRRREEGPPEVFAIYTDITDQKHREEQLERQNDRLENFASIVSHDLRNPLNVAAGRLALARDERDSEHLTAVGRALDRMDQIIEDMLLLTWGGQEIDADEVEACAVGEMAEACWSQVETNEATLVLEEPPTVQASEGRLRQLLENLFRNAVEHAGEDVTVTVGPTDGGFYVADDGPGIPEEERESVLEAGYSTDEEGTGLGLSIAKTIVEAHGWTLSIGESEAGGARFEITEVERTTSVGEER